MQTKGPHTLLSLSASTFTTDGGLTRSIAFDSKISNDTLTTTITQQGEKEKRQQQQQQREEEGERERNSRTPLDIMTCVGELTSVWRGGEDEVWRTPLTTTQTRTLPARIVIDENDPFWRPLILYQQEQRQQRIEEEEGEEQEEQSPPSPLSPLQLSFYHERQRRRTPLGRRDGERRRRWLPVLMDHLG
ncbi:hypothetical protein LSM04_009494 [Trypanosoma melophagium]|uniref:uncharacterized protein n=1 Tax=Trypanosoma melophagium TaxID=715481 RepID=UPI00351A4825|nr:hypothetical protein LSM04_009494 [Trypanosoma melophagium]